MNGVPIIKYACRYLRESRVGTFATIKLLAAMMHALVIRVFC